MPLFSPLARAGLNPGVLAGSAAGAVITSNQRKPVSKAGKIAGIVAGAVVLILLSIIAVCIDRRRRRRAKHGTKILDREEEMEALAGTQMPNQLIDTPHVTEPLYSGQGKQPIGMISVEGRYDMGGYASPPVGGDIGSQGTQYYRNQ
jgi:hypothetical protein